MVIREHAIREMVRAHNAEGQERQREIASRAGTVLRDIGMTPAELATYQGRIAGIELRFATVTAKSLKRPVRLFR